MEEKANDLPSAMPFLSGLLTVGAVLIWGQGIFPRGTRQQRSSSGGAPAR